MHYPCTRAHPKTNTTQAQFASRVTLAHPPRGTARSAVRRHLSRPASRRHSRAASPHYTSLIQVPWFRFYIWYIFAYPVYLPRTQLGSCRNIVTKKLLKTLHNGADDQIDQI